MRRLVGMCILAVAVAGSSGSALAQMQDEEMMAEPQGEMTLYFVPEDTELDDQAKQDLASVVRWLNENPNREVVIAGHVEEIGAPHFDRDVSLRRAMAVKNHLTQMGISPDRIEVVAVGQAPSAELAQPSPDRIVIFYATRPDQPVGEADVDIDVEQPAQVEQDTEYEQEYGYDTTQPQAVPPPGEMPPQEETYETGTEHLMTPMGMSLSVGGGVQGFIDEDMRDFTDVGGAWEARLTLGTRRVLGAEVAYIGTAQGVDALGLDDDAILVSNGVEGNLRLNFLSTQFQPYVFGGIGWSHFDITNADFNQSSLQDNEDVLYVPVGLGLGFRYMGFMFDIRGTLRAAFEDDIIRGTEVELEDDPDVAMDAWNVSAKVGWEF